jgi:hypothetical protein
MHTEIARVAVRDTLTHGPRLVVVPADAGATPEARYLQHRAVGDRLPAGNALVAIVRSDPLSTPDQIQVTHADRQADSFVIGLEIRTYDGALLANVVTVGLAQVELGSLPPGSYAIRVDETRMQFQQMEHPEQATVSTIQTYQIQFTTTPP